MTALTEKKSCAPRIIESELQKNGNVFWEILQRIKPPPDVPCPACGRKDSSRFIECYGKCDRCVKIDREKEAKREAMAALWLNSGLPAEAKLCTFGNTDPERTDPRAIQACREWVYGSRGLYLWGSTGAGKTHLSYCLANREIIEHQRRVLFLPLPLLFQDLKESFLTGATEPRRLLSVARSVPLLILDDIGVGHSREFGEREILPIVDSRLGASLPTIYTSNLSWSQKKRVQGFGTLEERLGPRVAQRVIHSAAAVRVIGQMNWLTAKS